MKLSLAKPGPLGLVALALALLAIGTVAYEHWQAAALDGIAFGNGRIEAQTFDIATRHAARVTALPVEEGQIVEKDAVVAELDMNDLAASLDGARANIRAATQQKAAAAAMVAQAQAAMTLAAKDFARVNDLARDKAVSQSRLDQAINAKQAAAANLDAAKQKLDAASASVEVAQAEADRIADLLKDKTLRAPKTGRVLYKLAEIGEVVGNGGRVVTMIDPTDVYMSIFLPTAEAARLHIGTEARIVLDALPDRVIPAYVSYISPEAQFTPRQVETRSEREKLTFRVKVRVPEAILSRHIDAVRTGLPGLAYVKYDAARPWPEKLQGDPKLLKEMAEGAP